MKSNPRVHIASLDSGYETVVPEALAAVGFFDDVPTGARVFLKPNLTFPRFRPGVMTSIECLRAVVSTLSRKGYRVIIGEADSGGYNRFNMDEVFKGVGIFDLAEEFGVEVVNISFTEPLWMEVRSGWRRLRVPVPKLLLEEVDAFVTLPVPKIHMNTGVSMSIKNQWGCIQEPSERLKLHPYFSEVMFQLNRRLPRAYSVIDGRFGLNRTGPMLGDVVNMNFLLASDDLVAADRTCVRIMDVPEEKIGHLMHFKKRGWWTPFENIRLNRPPANFKRETFFLKRAWTDIPGLLCFNNAFLAWLGYHSPLAGFAHWLLYLFREPFYEYDSEKAKLRAKAKTLPPPGSNKVLVFAHVPPPHHGQSYMVKLTLEAFGGDNRGRHVKGDLIPQPQEVSTEVKLFHVNCSISDRMDDIGEVHLLKILKLFRFCFEALWCRLRHDVRVFYYVPAPGKRTALYRDWIVMALCRPFFGRVVFHWHATGLGEWVEKHAHPIERRISHLLLDCADVSVVLTEFNRPDAAVFRPKTIHVLPNGIPDFCPDFDKALAPARAARERARAEVRAGGDPASLAPAHAVFRALFLSHCTRAKGLFDALEIAARTAARARRAIPWLAFHLDVAGSFQDAAEEREFAERLRAKDLAGVVTYHGFVAGRAKYALLERADVFLFPSHWDNCPVALIEAFSFDLPILATRTNGVPALFPDGYPYLFEVGDVDGMSARLSDLMGASAPDLALRAHFLARFSLERYVRSLEEMILP